MFKTNLLNWGRVQISWNCEEDTDKPEKSCRPRTGSESRVSRPTEKSSVRPGATPKEGMSNDKGLSMKMDTKSARNIIRSQRHGTVLNKMPKTTTNETGAKQS